MSSASSLVERGDVQGSSIPKFTMQSVTNYPDSNHSNWLAQMNSELRALPRAAESCATPTWSRKGMGTDVSIEVLSDVARDTGGHHGTWSYREVPPIIEADIDDVSLGHSTFAIPFLPAPALPGCVSPTYEECSSVEVLVAQFGQLSISSPLSKSPPTCSCSASAGVISSATEIVWAGGPRSPSQYHPQEPPSEHPTPTLKSQIKVSDSSLLEYATSRIKKRTTASSILFHLAIQEAKLINPRLTHTIPPASKSRSGVLFYITRMEQFLRKVRPHFLSGGALRCPSARRVERSARGLYVADRDRNHDINLDNIPVMEMPCMTLSPVTESAPDLSGALPPAPSIPALQITTACPTPTAKTEKALETRGSFLRAREPVMDTGKRSVSRKFIKEARKVRRAANRDAAFAPAPDTDGEELPYQTSASRRVAPYTPVSAREHPAKSECGTGVGVTKPWLGDKIKAMFLKWNIKLKVGGPAAGQADVEMESVNKHENKEDQNGHEDGEDSEGGEQGDEKHGVKEAGEEGKEREAGEIDEAQQEQEEEGTESGEGEDEDEDSACEDLACVFRTLLTTGA